MKVNGQWVPCVHNSSYSFIPIPLALYRCLDHALKMCMWFEKVQVGKDQEKAQSEKDSHSKNQGGKKQTNNQVLIP